MEKSIRYLFGTVILSLAIASVLNACKKNSDSDNSRLAPIIKSIYPDIVAPGGTVIITGENFTTEKDVVSVNISGKAAIVSSADSSEIVIQVPQDASSGKLSVTIDKRTAEAPFSLIINAITPVISEVNPATAAIGEEITVSGKNFANNLTVSIGDKPAEAQGISATSFKVTIPEGTNNGRVIITSNGATAISPAVFYTPARITSLSASSGIDGEEITINGENFTSNKKDIEISFGEGAATQEDILLVSSTSIKVKAPVSGTNGRVIVKQFGTSSNSRNFNYIPSITSFEPAIIEAGETLTIYGHRFGSNNTVYLNRTVTPLEITPTSIKVVIPTEARTGKIEVRVGSSSNSPKVISQDVLKVVNIWEPVTVVNAPTNLNATSPVVIGSKVYFIGFLNNFVFDITNNTWSQGPEIPSEIAAISQMAYVVKDGIAYMGIGSSTDGLGRRTKVWYEFDPSRNTPFRKMTDFPYETSSSLAFIHDNKMYAGLGRDGENKLYTFNPEGSGSWTEAMELNVNFQSNAVHFKVDNTIYFGAGLTNDLQINNEFYRFEPGAQNPTPMVSNFPVSSGSQKHGVSLANKGYVYQGNRFFRFNTATADWTELPGTGSINHLVTVNNRCFLFYQSNVYEYIPRP